MRTIKIGRRTFKVLFPDLLRPLNAAERKRLTKSIRASGVDVPIIVDEEDGIIDGINRAEIAAEVGLVNVPTAVRPGLTLEEKREIAEDRNTARRMLSPEEMEKLRDGRIERAAEALRGGKSMRKIAQEEGVSPQQISNDIKDATVKGLTVEPEDGMVKGIDGKVRRLDRMRRTHSKRSEPLPIPQEPVSPPKPGSFQNVTVPAIPLGDSGAVGVLKKYFRLASPAEREFFLQWVRDQETEPPCTLTPN